jgi:hypothetical protein
MTQKALSQLLTITLLATTGAGLSWASSESTDEDPSGPSACEAMCQKAEELRCGSDDGARDSKGESCSGAS